MYRDRSLVPAEAVRLLALGVLVEGDRRYGDLATEIRFFTQRIVGPSLDLLGSSLELLRIEGLAETTGGASSEEDTVLRITESGRDLFRLLMDAQLRAPINDVGRLVLLLKLRFLKHLSDDAKEDQLDLLCDVIRTERARASDLAKEYEGSDIADWLAFDVQLADRRIEWLETALSEFGVSA
ncbi:hypothetical protein HH303_00680 [Rhodospirillaceae bacterium KN72]|uniref:PadR family transcriptional regulator n=1 Tax=Pacificispira spongiicola TaxID=2729598 RepID=A0A7Y0DWN4_9PROT|nr:hypothetical protein [Pacificispira spongiicola]NMM42972.1 hypothetical protein [Pacificispira spongiicola]